jgi:peptide/nickel transport system permease protein
VSALARYPALRVVGRRLLLAIPLLIVISTLTFLLVALVPGNPAYRILGIGKPPQLYTALNEQLGVTKPVYDRFGHWAWKASRGDLGDSLYTQQPVTTTIKQRVGVTMSLVFGSLLVIGVLGIGIGVFTAVVGGLPGRLVDGLSVIGFALPGFWVGAVLIAIFSVSMHLFPAVGYQSISESPTGWIRSLVLPVAALSLTSVAVLAKQTREAMMDVLASEHIRMARANGIGERDIYFRLALKNAAIRVVTVIGLQAVGLLLGTVFVEQVFALPGLGSALVNAATSGDLPVVQGITIFFTLIIIAVNLVTDVLYSVLDPRVKTS